MITFQVLGPLLDIAFLILLLVVGIVIIVLLAKVLLFILPAAIIGFVVWFIFGSFFWAGITFLVIALISLVWRPR